MENLRDQAVCLWNEGLGWANRYHAVVRFLVLQHFRSTSPSVKYEVQHMLPGQLPKILEIYQFNIERCRQGTSSPPPVLRRL